MNDPYAMPGGVLRNKQEFVTRLAELYGDLNVLHPFREGNGRAQRAFLAQLSADAGYALNWSGTDPQRNEDASVKSFLGDNSLPEQMLDELIPGGTPGSYRVGNAYGA